MSGDMIQGRNGEKILLSEYPPGYMDGLNERLNAIQGIEPEPEGVLDRAAEWVFDKVADGPGLIVILVIVALSFTGTAIAQIGRWLA